MRYTARPERIARTHQALAEVSRLRLLELLRAQPCGLDASEAAVEIGLHQATVREHLEMLVEAGLAERTREDRAVRGRPRVIYRATAAGEEVGGGGYRLLAELLASLIESSVRRPAVTAEAAGTAWGRSLVERTRPLARPSRAEAVGRVEELLGELGFEPEFADDKQGPRILLHRCPFRDVAAAHGTVVCSAHLGLIKGALEELGVAADTATLEPFSTPTLCIARLPAGPRTPQRQSRRA
jgi:predicted ArsR family transcriptional regulator